MTTFEYLSVFVSIVIGLSVAHVLTGVVRMFGEGASRIYWVHVVWCFMVLYTLTSFWWFSLDWQSQDRWTQPLFFFVVGFSMLNYVISVVIIPTTPPSECDYKAHFSNIRTRFFSLWALWSVVNLVDGILKGEERTPIGFGLEYWLVNLFFIIGFGAAAATPNERYQKAWAIFNLLWIPYDLFRVSDVFGA